jgi:hypothetical protein
MTDDQNTSHAAPADQELRIVVGVDGSECSDRALEFAAHEAARWGALLHVVGTYEIPSNSGWLVVPLGPFEEAAAANVSSALARVHELEPAVVTKGEHVYGFGQPCSRIGLRALRASRHLLPSYCRGDEGCMTTTARGDVSSTP